MINFALIGLESFRLSPLLSERVSSSSPCSVVFSDDGKDGFDLNQEHFDFQLSPELTRLDMVSSALEWLENLDSCNQMRSHSPQLRSVSFPESPHNMMTYTNTNVDFNVSAAVACSNPTAPKNVLFPQPEATVTDSGNNFPHCVPQQKARGPDTFNCVSHYSGSDKEWKRERYAVPDECKDERYWRKRSRNNMSAKKSREAKRAKDILIARKIDELEKENAMLKMMLTNLMLQQPQQMQHNNNGICFCGNKFM